MNDPAPLLTVLASILGGFCAGLAVVRVLRNRSVDLLAETQAHMSRSLDLLMRRIEGLEACNPTSACPYCKGEGRMALVGNNGERVMAAYCLRCLPPGMQRA